MLQYAFSTRPVPAFRGNLRLNGKTVLITGASSGIGRACAIRLARDGASLILTGRRLEALRATASAAGGATVIEGSLDDHPSVARFCDAVLGTGLDIDVLIHNAGVGIHAPSYATDPDAAQSLVFLNFLAPVEITRRLLPRIRAGGSIVAVSSIAGKLSLPGIGVYSASKHALNAYANILRLETRDRGIHVLSVCPGYVRTPFASNVLQGAPSTPFPGRNRFGITAEQCAGAIRTGILKRKRTVVVPRLGWLLVAIQRIVPTAADALAARHFAREGPR